MGFITLTDGTVIHGSQLPQLNNEPLGWYYAPKVKLKRVTSEEIEAIRPKCYKLILP